MTKRKRDMKRYIQTKPRLLEREIYAIVREQSPPRKDQVLAGLAVRMARTWGFSGISAGRNNLPSQLPVWFPKSLAKKAYDASRRELIKMRSGNDKMGWKSAKGRVRALENQVILFSGARVMN